MKTRHKWVLAAMALVVVAAAVCLLLERWAENASQRAATLEAQYQEMTYAMVHGQAGERSPDHPMARLYAERRDALLQAGYLKTREFTLRHPFPSSRASSSFLHRFITNFPGVEVRLRAPRDEPPVVTVCARDRDLLAIKWFIVQNDKAE